MNTGGLLLRHPTSLTPPPSPGVLLGSLHSAWRLAPWLCAVSFWPCRPYPVVFATSMVLPNYRRSVR